MNVAILTISDRSFRGERDDMTGPALKSWLEARGVAVLAMMVVPDEEDAISHTLQEWADDRAFDLIITNGGTGVAPRDVTPEATRKILHREIPGLSEIMRLKSLEKTPMAVLSRAIAGSRGRTLIINLPGSPQGAVENLEAAWPAIPHAVAKIQGDPSDCAPLEEA